MMLRMPASGDRLGCTAWLVMRAVTSTGPMVSPSASSIGATACGNHACSMPAGTPLDTLSATRPAVSATRILAPSAASEGPHGVARSAMRVSSGLDTRRLP